MYEVIKPLFKNGKGCLYYLCRCHKGHFQKVRRDVLDSARCCECVLEKYQKEAENVSIKLLNSVGEGSGLYLLPCGCERVASFSEVREGRGYKCRTHNERYTFLYVVKLEYHGFSWLKIGVTSNKLGGRLHSYKTPRDVVFSCIAFHVYEDKIKALKEEKRLSKQYEYANLEHNMMKRYMGNGFTECYAVSIEGSLKDEVSSILY